MSYYAVLGIPPNATPEDIKRAYRALVRQWHPDVNPDPSAADRFREIQHAYEVLSDPSRRAAYDAGGTGDESTGSRPVFPAPTAPLDVARQLFETYTKNDLLTLRSWRGQFMRWETTHWREIDIAELRSDVYAVLGDAAYWHEIRIGGLPCQEQRAWSPDKRKVANVIEAMAAVGHLTSDADAPEWIAQRVTQTPAGQMVSCRNGLLDLRNRALMRHTPALFNLVSVPFDYDPAVSQPAVWLAFLQSVWGEDEDSISLLQEYFGYILSGRLDMQKMLLLHGPTRSGKGTIERLLVQLIGKGNVASPTLNSIGTNFGLSSLLGKPLAFVTDARMGNGPSHVVVERLLSITGEDLIDIDRKYRDVWTGKLPTRFILLSNELPKFRDASAAITGRLLILRMTKSFLGREDHELDARLSAELPGILNWALDGLDRLNRQKKFTEPQSSSDSRVMMMDLASPVGAFVRECCVIRPDLEVSRDELFTAWRGWAENNNHRPGSKSTFGRDLNAVVPELGKMQHRTGNQKTWYYAHIGILPVPPVPGVPPAGTGTHSAPHATNPQFRATGTPGTGNNRIVSPSTEIGSLVSEGIPTERKEHL